MRGRASTTACDLSNRQRESDVELRQASTGSALKSAPCKAPTPFNAGGMAWEKRDRDLSENDSHDSILSPGKYVYSFFIYLKIF